MAAAAEPNRPQLLAIWRRRRLPMLIAFAVTLLAALLAAFLWPPTYVSTGTILIEQQEVPVDLVRSTISSFADQRIQMINQRVMTSDNLLGIVQKYDLYKNERKRRGREKILDLIRGDIHFGSIKASVIDPRQGRPVEATIAFSLSFQSRYPEIAARVANELSSLYLQENLESRKQQADLTTSFLTEEADKLRKSIEGQTAELAQFKREHINSLPELAGLTLQQASRADDDKRDVDMQIRSLDQQIIFLQAQLAQVNKTSSFVDSTGQRIMSPSDRLKFVRSEYSRLNAIYGAENPDVKKVKREMDGLAAVTTADGADNDRQRQLRDFQTQLAALRARGYTQDNPDVKRLENLVASLSTPVAGDDAANAPAPKEDEPDNPAYMTIAAQLDAARTERAGLERKRADLVARAATLESRLASTPGVEKDYAALVRELDSTQLKYKEYRQKQAEAQLAQNLETERKGEKFTLIDPAVTADEPASPNRRMILIMGVVLALGLAAGMAVLLEMTDQRIHGRNAVAGLLAVPPLAVIPWIENATQRAARLRRQRFALYGSIATCACAIVAMHYLYRPLDVLWAIAMRRLGS